MIRSLEVSERRRVVGRLAGILFTVGALVSVPANLLYANPAVTDRAHYIDAMAFVSGVVCFLIPWDRVRPGWFHLVPAVAGIEVALSVWGVRPHGAAYSWFFVFVAVFVAYAFEDRRQIAAHMAFACAAFAVPLAYGGNGPDNLVRTVVAAPILLVLAGVVTYLREELEARQRELEAQAIQDPLTGLPNRRRLELRLDYEISRHARNGRSLTLFALDLDRFKAVNDTLGHSAGDHLLREVAAVLSAAVRAQDTVVRQGGDEFLVLAPELEPDEAEALAARMIDALAGITALDRPLTSSVGWASYPDDATGVATLLEAADASEREVKRSARAQAARLRPAA